MSDARYDPATDPGHAIFDYRFTEETELTGYMKLRLWVEALGSEDMDLFVAIQKLDRDGSEVPFIFYAMMENGPVALGWLRVSHRELDEGRSRPAQPFHTHVREQWLKEGERAAVDIEIWPSSTRFDAARAFSQPPDGNAHEGVEEGKAQSLQNPQIGVGQPQIQFDRLSQDGEDRSIGEIE